MYEQDRKRIIENANNGVITTEWVSAHKIHRGTLKKMLEDGYITQCSRGIYNLSDELDDDYYLLQLQYMKGIFSHETALYLMGYSERVPLELHMTFPQKYNCTSLKQRNVRVTRVKNENYDLGRSLVKTPLGNLVQSYNLERSICDVLRGNKGDTQTILYAMKKYVNSKNKNINRLMDYARQLHVEKKVSKYLEVLL